MFFLRNNFWIMLLFTTFVVGILYAAPQFLIWHKLNQLETPYLVIQLTHHSDEAYGHMPIAREIYDGRFPPGDLYFSENAPSLFGPFPFPYLIMAFFIKVAGGNINLAYDLAHVIVPPLIFLLFYWLGYVLTQKKMWSLFGGLLGVFTPLAYHLPNVFRSLDNFGNIALKNFYPLIKTPLPDLFLGRTMDPLLTYVIFIPAIMALIIFWRTPSKKSGVWAGVALGALYYSYFHYWVYVTIVVGLLGLIILIQRKQSPERWRAMLWLAGVAALMTIPYWINFFQYMKLPSSREATDGLGTMEYGRSFRLLQPFSVVFDYFFYIALGLVVYWFWWRNSDRANRPQAILYWVFIVAMFVTWNIQVVVGYVPQPDHWFRAFSPFIFVIIIHALYELLRRINQRAVAVGLIALSLLLVVKKINNVLIFVNPPAQVLAEYSFNPHIINSWQWISKNISGEPVIASPSFVSSLYFTTTTAVRPYLATRVNSSVSNSILEDRFLKTFKAFDMPSVMVERLLRSDPQELCDKFVDCSIPNTNDTQNWLRVPRNLYSSYYKNQIKPDASTVFHYVTEVKAQELTQRYQQLPSVFWDQLDAEYVYYGPWERQLVKKDLSHDPRLVLVYKSPEAELYKIKK